MTIVPNYDSPPIWRRRPWALSEILAWGIVIIMATLAALSAVVQQRNGAAPATQAGMFKFAAQYLVGLHEYTRGGGFAGASDDQLLKELEGHATTTEDRVRLAIVSGEFMGPEEGVRRLDAIADQDASRDAAAAKSILAGDTLPAGERQAFRDKYDWFADLAESIGKPAGDPLRNRTLGAAQVTLWSVLIVILAGLGMTGLGLLLLVIGLVLLAIGRIKPLFRRQGPGQEMPADRRTYLQGFAWYLSGMLCFSLILHFLLKLTLHDMSPLAGAAVEFGGLGLAFAIGVSWPLIMGQNAAQSRAALGLHMGRGFFREIGSGLLGYVAGLPLLAAGLFVTALLVKASGISGSHPVTDDLTRGYGLILIVFVLASIWAPVTEELMFRGALFSHLRERFPWWASAPIVAIVFAIIHPQGWVALPALGAIAIVLAGIREWRGSIIGCIAAHAFHNTVTLIYALFLLRSM